MRSMCPNFKHSRAFTSSVVKMNSELEARRQARETARLWSSFFDSLHRSVFIGVSRIYGTFTKLLQKMYEKVLQAVGPQPAVKPSNHTVVWALFAFMFYLAFTSIAVRFPTCKVKVAFITTTSVIIFALSFLLWRDFMTASNRKYKFMHLYLQLKPF